jgi:hypothetical protein
VRLSDARLRCNQTKLIYPNHRPSPGLAEDATPRPLEPIVRAGNYGLHTNTVAAIATIRTKIPETVRILDTAYGAINVREKLPTMNLRQP